MKTVFLFPGQGAQYVGMGLTHLRGLPELAATVEAASQALGEDLWRAMTRGPRQTLTQTDVAQVAIFVLSLALYRRLADTVAEPLAMAGHSLGEFSALVAAGALDFDSGLRLVIERGRLMHEQNLAADGAMLAISGLSGQETEAAIADISDCWVGNYNAPTQQILSGLRPALRMAEMRLRGTPVKLTWLEVAGAYHTPLFVTAAARFAHLVKMLPLRDARVPVIANTDARLLRHADDIRSELIVHMLAPVRWSETMEVVAGLGPDAVVEVGPGKVLSGLALRNCPELTCLRTDGPRDLAQTVARLTEEVSCAST